MRSCAFLIFEAATISMALVILRVFWTLLILVRISRLPAIFAFCLLVLSGASRPLAHRSRCYSLVRCIFLEILDSLVKLRFVVLAEVLGGLDALDELRVLALHVVAHRALGGERLLHVDVVVVAVV